jgi:Bifunctional DNA primase/polymerase, N-terminal
MTIRPVSFHRTTLNVYQTALVALRCGISFIPIVANGTKSPAVRWKDYQKKMPTLREARQWFYGKERGIAFITGFGGLEMLDFDSHTAYEEFVERIRQEGLVSLLDRIEQGYKELSPKGVHLYYRCALIEGNKKLAQRPLQEPPWLESKIETRGEGGYGISAPSCGRVHPSGQPYQLVQGSLATIQTIMLEDRALLLSVARTLDAMPTAPREGHRPKKMVQLNNERRRPGTIFNERAAWSDILEPHGWTWVKRIGSEDFWRRPGKDVGISATTNYEESNYLYVFSTSTLFEPRVGISKFAAYTFLEHNGDFFESTKALVAQGYVEADDNSSVC